MIVNPSDNKKNLKNQVTLFLRLQELKVERILMCFFFLFKTLHTLLRLPSKLWDSVFPVNFQVLLDLFGKSIMSHLRLIGSALKTGIHCYMLIRMHIKAVSVEKCNPVEDGEKAGGRLVVP